MRASRSDMRSAIQGRYVSQLDYHAHAILYLSAVFASIQPALLTYPASYVTNQLNARDADTFALRDPLKTSLVRGASLTGAAAAAAVSRVSGAYGISVSLVPCIITVRGIYHLLEDASLSCYSSSFCVPSIAIPVLGCFHDAIMIVWRIAQMY